MAVSQLEDLWFGENEIKCFIDGDEEFPTICGTGLEDYFLGSYGFPELYSTAYSGVTLRDGRVRPDDPAGGSQGTDWSLYRWHLVDPIRFGDDLRITFQALGPRPGQELFHKRSDDFASVAYWYQLEPHATFPALPDRSVRVR